MIRLDKIFKRKKELDKEILYYLSFFNIVVDMLAILIKRAKEEGQMAGVIPHLVDDWLSIL
jgi:hypothetical protein